MRNDVTSCSHLLFRGDFCSIPPLVPSQKCAGGLCYEQGLRVLSPDTRGKEGQSSEDCDDISRQPAVSS